MGTCLLLGLFAGTEMGLRWVLVPGLWEMAASPGLLQICLAPGLFLRVAVTRPWKAHVPAGRSQAPRPPLEVCPCTGERIPEPAGVSRSLPRQPGAVASAR